MAKVFQNAKLESTFLVYTWGIMNTHTLVRWSFWWSEVRLVVAAVALFLGGVPPALYFLPGVPLVGSLLILCWIISGAASLYLAWEWYQSGGAVFGGRDKLDAAALAVSVVSGINLGLTGIIGRNIGMSISSAYPVFLIVGLLYVASAVYLYNRFNKVGHLFAGQA